MLDLLQRIGAFLLHIAECDYAPQDVKDYAAQLDEEVMQEIEKIPDKPPPGE